jgi:hypothetical protein
MSENNKRKYCPDGQRWNNTTKKCEPKETSDKKHNKTRRKPALKIVETLTTFQPININPNTPDPLLNAITEPISQLFTANVENPNKVNITPINKQTTLTNKKVFKINDENVMSTGNNVSLNKIKESWRDIWGEEYVIDDDLISLPGSKLRPIWAPFVGKPTTTSGSNPFINPTLLQIEITRLRRIKNNLNPSQIPVTIPSPEPVVLPSPEPVVLPSPEPVALPSPEPVIIPSPEPVIIPSPEPVIIPSPEPVALLSPENIVENGYNEEQEPPIEISEKLSNTELLQHEKEEYEMNKDNTEYDFLYPHLNDPNFNEKIAKRKEFNDTKYDGKVRDIKQYSNKVCKADFEIAPHQLFVKNFLSLNTPYNSLLLYNGLGTGKTCSAIGIAEEMRSYMKQVGITQRIIVIASPNVQSNFKMQLFDESKLKSDNGLWSLNTCIGTALLKEINPTNLTDIPKEKIINQINAIINSYYVFMGYTEFANYIQKKITIPDGSGYSSSDIKKIEISRIKKLFNNRLIIIDEVHNIRNADDNKNKRIGELLMNVVKNSDNLRLLLLSATPMYNNYKEIIWLVNLMNANDKRATIKEEQIFDKKGNFIKEQITDDGRFIEGGRELLERKLIGYVSYVRGENPYTFPYRIYPTYFSKENTFENIEYPKLQMNEKPIETPLQHIPVYNTSIGEYQQKGYDFIMNNLRNKSIIRTDKYGKQTIMPTFENLDSFGYTLLQVPLEALNIVYPSSQFDEIMMNEEKIKELTDDENTNIIENIVGHKGLTNIMNYATTTSPQPMRYNFEYKPDIINTYGRIFHSDNIGKYSNKIANICNIIKQSKGIIIIYSQYIDGGAVPIALALEEMGFTRYGSASYTKPLFKKALSEPLDSLTMKPKSEVTDKFRQAKYVMITGDRNFSPNNAGDIKFVTKPENKNGEFVKVIIISKAGSEGLDFKNIRQTHILEPWYNMNRIEQIIGRSVRNLSHCQLPFEERNVEIYLHTTLPRNDEEPADLYVYRLAEKKAIQIGNITRILKQNAVDCILNIGQTNFTIEKLNSIVENQNIELSLSSGKKIQFKIGDKPFTDICDYMDNCSYTCSPNVKINSHEIVSYTYNNEFVKTNYQSILKRIKQLFKDQSFYKKEHLINAINIMKPYPIEQIYYTLSQFIDNKNEHLIDKYGRLGSLINKGEYYAFQPIEITDENASIFERTYPIDYKNESIFLEIAKNHEITGKDDETKEEIVRTYENIMDEINEILKNIKNKSVKLEAGDNDWYKHAITVIEILQKKHNITGEKTIEYMLYHYLDTLTLREQLLIINKIYSTNFNSNMLLDIIIKKYFDGKILEVGNKKAIVLAYNDKTKLYIQSNELLTLWNESDKQSDKEFFQDAKMRKFLIAGNKFNDNIGFMQLFRDTGEITFKIKDMKQKRNNKGSRIDRLRKNEIIAFFNQVLGYQEYNNENTEPILKISLCVMLEIVLRYYNEMRKNDKVWFLDVETAIINNISECKINAKGEFECSK